MWKVCHVLVCITDKLPAIQTWSMMFYDNSLSTLCHLWILAVVTITHRHFLGRQWRCGRVSECSWSTIDMLTVPWLSFLGMTMSSGYRYCRIVTITSIRKLHIWRSIWSIAYRGMLYIFAIIKRNHFEVIMCVCFSHDTKHAHFEMISFYNSKDI